MTQLPTPTHAPIQQAFVARLRANASLKSDLTGGMHEGFAPEDAAYPFLVYNLVYGPYDYNWGDVTLIAGIDCFVFSRNPVEARNLDAVIAGWVSDQPLPVDGQDTLLCRRIATVPMPPDIDAEQKKVYQAGGSYEIWTNAPITARVFEVGASDSAPASDNM